MLSNKLNLWQYLWKDASYNNFNLAKISQHIIPQIKLGKRNKKNYDHAGHMLNKYLYN